MWKPIQFDDLTKGDQVQLHIHKGGVYEGCFDRFEKVEEFYRIFVIPKGQGPAMAISYQTTKIAQVDKYVEVKK